MERLAGALAALLILFGGVAARAEPAHAIAMHGSPALSPDYTAFPYANANAPKGGKITYGVEGTFNSVNPFIVQGDAARGLFDQTYGYNVFESLLARSRDEAFTLYPLIAKSVETDEERSFVEFTLDERARFSDGQPVTVEDVMFSMDLLHEKSRPLYRRWLDNVQKMEATAKDKVRFTLKPGADREMPLLIALLPILPKHATDAEHFDKTTLKSMVATGPYTIARVDAGQSITLKRNPDYWAKDHPSKAGFDNYDEIQIIYFRDENTMFEAFKKGLIDVFEEKSTKRWVEGYDFPAVSDGRIVKSGFNDSLPSGMYGFVFNTRRPVFADREVRRALADLFDFEWANQNLFSGAYTRTRSFFDGSELSSHGQRLDEREKAFFQSHPGAALPEALEGTLQPAISDGSGRDRNFMRQGFDRLRAAGYKLADKVLTGPDGKPLSFEILLRGKGGEALAAAWQRTLANLGVAVSIRSVDDAQYQQRLQTYDYDVILQFYYSSLSPGAEQIGRWGSGSRDLDGTYNFAGVADPAIDDAIDNLLHARSKEEFVSAVRAYDRVLLSGFYVVPLYHLDEQRVAHASTIRRPGKTAIYGYQLQTWWREQ